MPGIGSSTDPESGTSTRQHRGIVKDQTLQAAGKMDENSETCEEPNGATRVSQ